jgi:hypothetical protein
VVKKDTVCFAPPEGIYTKQNEDIPLAFQGEMRNYVKIVTQRIYEKWSRNLSVAQRNAWSKRRFMAIRFAILPDGSYDMPVVTVSSGSPSDDAHALNAIKAFSSFERLPAGFNKPFLFCARFGYNVQYVEEFPPSDDDPWQVR